jgi:hypothetical protein
MNKLNQATMKHQSEIRYLTTANTSLSRRTQVQQIIIEDITRGMRDIRWKTNINDRQSQL